jgi:predicted DNA-binding mobile mystery protein A
MVQTQDAKLARAALDARLSRVPLDELAGPKGGWIRAIRDALQMSGEALGRRLGVTHAAISELERNERAGTIRLESLRKVAEALDCTLVYALVPRHGLDATVRTRAEDLVDADLRRVAQSMALEDQGAPVYDTTREALVERLIESGRLWSSGP